MHARVDRKLARQSVWLLGLLLACGSASADDQPDRRCVFNTNQAIVCIYPEPAAIAFVEFGFDGSAATSYNNELLHRAGCGGIPRGWEANKNFPIERKGRIPTRSGWIDVAWVKLADGLTYWTASDYLSKSCFSRSR